MIDIDKDRVWSALRCYGLVTGINIDTPMVEVGSIFGKPFSIPLETTVNVQVACTFSGISNLVTDLERIKSLRDEEYLRGENPTLQKTWEEYQLLLKLSR